MFLCTAATLASGQEKTYVKVRDLVHELMVFDENVDCYLPFLNEEHYKTNTLSFYLDEKEYQNCELLINTSSRVSLFIDNRLYKNLDVVGPNYLSIGDLPLKETSFLTIYGLQGADNLKGLEIVYAKPVFLDQENAYNKIHLRKQDPMIDIIIIVFLLILFAYAFLRISRPRLYSWYFDISKLVTNTTTDLNIVVSSFSGSAFLLIGLNSLVISFCMILFKYKNVLLSDEIALSMSPWSIVWELLALMVLVFLGFILKFLFLRFIGSLIGTSRSIKLHFFEFNRLLTISLCIGLPLTIIAFYSGDASLNWLRYTFVVMFLLSVLRIIFVVNSESNFRIVYLFSYICTTEIVPVLILAKYFGFERL